MSATEILVVEDEGIIAQNLQAELSRLGYRVPATASSGEEAVEMAADGQPDLVLMDIVLKGQMDGIEAGRHIRDQLDIPVVYLTAYEDDATLGRAKESEPFGYLLKPYEERELHTTIEVALHKHRMEQRVRDTERWLAATLLSIADAVVATDSHLRLRFANPAARALMGWDDEDLVGRELAEVCRFVAGAGEPLEDLAARAIHAGESVALPGESFLIGRDGQRTPVEGKVAPISDHEGNLSGVVLAFQDISERHRLEEARRQSEEQLRQVQKMEAVGRLAGGVAHDFNNLLTAILGNVALTLARLPVDDPGAGYLAEAEAAAQRAARHVQKLLGFSGRASLALEPLNLNDCLRALAPELQEKGTAQSEPELILAPDLWAVQADAVQLAEVLRNLCANAQEAIAEGGRLVVETENVLLRETRAGGPPNARPGEFVRLRVTDTGRGMSSAVQARILEPFFTTKPETPGAGLGLALVFGIVEQHHGWVECRSEPGWGTQFDVYLPRHWQRPAVHAAPPPVPKRPDVTPTVLLADDEPMLRGLARTVLERAGYRLLLAEDGAQAVELFQQRWHEIDLVILDMTMPRLSGQEAFGRVLEIDPGARVLLSSGYAPDLQKREDQRALGFLSKPYRPDGLVAAVRAALAQSGGAGEDLLRTLARRLGHALECPVASGRERLARLVSVLDRVVQAMQAHAGDVEADDGIFSDAEYAQPALARQVEALRRRYGEFLRQAAALKAEAHAAETALASGEDTDEQPGFQALREHVGRFAAALEAHRRKEVQLILDSTNTELGAGD